MTVWENGSHAHCGNSPYSNMYITTVTNNEQADVTENVFHRVYFQEKYSNIT